MALAGRELILAVTGSIAAYKAAYLLRELRRAEAAVTVVMTAARARVRRAAHVPDALRPAGPDRPVRPAGARGRGARGAGRARRPAPRRAGHGARAGAGGARARRRLPGHAPPRRCAGPCSSPRPWTAACGSTPRCRPTWRRSGPGGPPCWSRITASSPPASGARAGSPRSRTSSRRPSGLLWPRRDLAGDHVLVTAGPTREPLDPVRYLSNRSSGRMGYAIAAQAARRGAAVTLVTGPTHLAPPAGDPRDPGADRARDARRGPPRGRGRDGRDQGRGRRRLPAGPPAAEKIASKQDGLTVALAPTPDILRELARGRAPGSSSASPPRRTSSASTPGPSSPPRAWTSSSRTT